MPLQKAKRNVAFYKGLADGTDRFLLQPPAIDYAENLTLGKDGSFSKRFGFSEIAQVQSPNGSPYFLETIEDSLVTLDGNSVRSFDGSGWKSTQIPGFVGQSEMLAETGPVSGSTHYAYQPWNVSGVVSAHSVAFEVREGAAGDRDTQPPSLSVFLYMYDADGRQTGRLTIPGAHSPKLLMCGTSLDLRHILIYHDAALGLRARPVFPLAGTIGAEVILGIEPSLQNRLNSHGSWHEELPGGVEPIQIQRANGRLGEGYDWESKYQVASDQTGIAVAWTERDTVDRIHLQSFDVFLAPDQGPVEVYTGSDAIDDSAEIFDVVIGGGYLHVLLSTYDTDTADTPEQSYAYLKYRVYARNNLAPATAVENLAVLPNRTLINGSLCLGDTGEVLVAYTIGGTSLWWYEATIDRSYNDLAFRYAATSLEWKKYYWLTGLTISDNHRLYHHRLVSSVVRGPDDKFYAMAQQWFDATPGGLDDDVKRIKDYVTITPALKPVTSSLVCLDDPSANGGSAYPVASLGAGQSLCVDPHESMMTGHKADLIVAGSEYWICNRLVHESAGISAWYGESSFYDPPNPIPVGVSSYRVVRAETPGKASARIHKITQFDGSYATAIGDGVVLGAGLPMWLTKSDVAELGPLDSPEIVSVWDYHWNVTDALNHPSAEYPAGRQEQDAAIWYSIPNNSTEQLFRKMAVVVGFSDSHGNIHRSAPSATVYVDRLTPDQASDNDTQYVGRDVRVTFTAPLSLVSREATSWFAELYVSDGTADDPVLVTTKNFAAGSSSISTYEIHAQVNRLQPAPIDWEEDDGGPDRTATIPLSAIRKSLYTAGGILAADPWPSLSHSVCTSTRLWGISADDRGRVIPSKLFEEFLSPEYNSTLTINLGDERNLTAIGKLDDKVVVFEPDDIHVIYGDGPDNRGEGQDFAVHYISTDVGCQDQESVIETPAGLVFYSSPRGFYLLDRNLQIQFIGAAIEDIAKGIRVKAATIDPGNAEVRFLVEPDPDKTQTVRFGPDPDTTVVTRPPRPVFGNTLPADACLAFFYETGDWMLYSSYPGVASCIYQRSYTKLLSDWTIWQESEGFADPVGTNRTLMRSPWIPLSDTVQDYQRLWKISFLGRYLSSLKAIGDDVYEAGDIIVRLYFDYEATYAQEKRFRMQDFGYDIFNHIPQRAERLQFEISPEDGRGRCQAVKIEIEEVNTEDLGEGIGYGLGNGFEIVSAELHMGVAPSMRALIPAAVKR